MKNTITVFAATSLLCACGFMTPTKQYAGDAQSAAAVAVVQSYVGNPFADVYHATITGYTKTGSAAQPGERKQFGLPGFTDYPNEIHVLPGEYEVQVYCFKSLSSHRPSTNLTLLAGARYLLRCDVQDGQARVAVSVSAT